MKEFSIPVKITLDCYLSVKANNQDEAYEVADEIAVDGEDIDLDEWRDPSDTDS